MENQKIAWLSITFADRISLNKNPEHVLDLVIISWKEIDRVLRPIIGKGGIEALFHHSVEITAQAYPWLIAASSDVHSALDLDALRHALTKKNTSHFAGASDSLLLNFYHLLSNLIGLSLTDRLLRPVLDPLLNGTAAKDI